MVASVSFAAANKNERRRKFLVDGQQIGRGMLIDFSAALPKVKNNFHDLPSMVLAQGTVQLNKAVVARWSIANQRICANSATKTISIGGARRHVLRFVDQDPRKRAVTSEKLFQRLQDFSIAEVLARL